MAHLRYLAKIKNESFLTFTVKKSSIYNLFCLFSPMTATIFKQEERLLYGNENFDEKFRIEIFINGEKTQKRVLENFVVQEAIQIIITGECENMVKCHIKAMETSDLEKDLQICLQTERKIRFNSEDNYYQILGVPYNATEEQIKAAFKRKILKAHPDSQNRNFGICSVELTQKLYEARLVLTDKEKRLKYDNFIKYKLSWFTKEKLEFMFYDRFKNGEWKHLLPQLGISALLISAGIAITIFTAGIGGPLSVAYVASAGTLIGSGLCSSMSLLSEKSVVEGASNSWKEFGKQMGVGAIAGCIGGACTAGISLGAFAMTSQAIASGVSETIVNPLVRVASCAIGGGIDSVAYTVTNGLACGNFQNMNAKEIAATIGCSAGLGIAGGVIAGGLTAGVGALRSVAGVTDELTGMAVATNQRAIQRALKGTIPVLEQIAEKVPKGTANRLKVAIEKNFAECSKESTMKINRSNEEFESIKNELKPFLNESDNAMVNEKEYFYFKNNLIALEASMEIEYTDGEGDGQKKLVRENDMFFFEQNISKITVKFKVARCQPFYVYVKKWNRITKTWIEPTVEHTFFFDRPKTRRFLLEGTSFYEKVTSVSDESGRECLDD